MNTLELIKKCLNKEPRAQRKLFDDYYRYIYTICFRYLQDHHDCQDVVSEVFNRVFSNIGKVYDTSNNGFKRWIQTIAINESLRFLKRKRPVIYTDENIILDGKEEVIEEQELLNTDQIWNIINEMPEGYRRIFLLHSIDGLTHAEISEYLSISRNTSKSQLLKARKYILAQIRNYESERI